ncbi:MAG: DUF3305 domain-containing protein [Betaproteobacteria bacterium]
MTLLRFPVAVLMQRTPLANRWISERWEPAAVEPLPADVAAAPPEQLVAASGERWRFVGHALELHRSEGEGYYLNLTAPDPKVFVMWRLADDGVAPAARPWVVTVSYNEAARMLDGGEQVDAVPLPEVIRAWMEPFVAENYKPEPKRKVRRNDPFGHDTARRDRERRG